MVENLINSNDAVLFTARDNKFAEETSKFLLENGVNHEVIDLYDEQILKDKFENIESRSVRMYVNVRTNCFSSPNLVIKGHNLGSLLNF